MGKLLRAIIKAFLLSFGAIFLSTRIGILCHEFLGHGVGALVVGGEVLESRIFLFHGGWIRYTGIPVGWEWLPLYAGSGVSCLIALAMVWCYRLKLSFGMASVLLVTGTGSFFQNAIYFLRSFHYGYGDGWELFTELGDVKNWITLGATPLLGFLAWRWTPPLVKVASHYLDHPSKVRLIVLLVVTFPLASGSFALLGQAELDWRDQGFQEVMRPLEKRVLDDKVKKLETEKALAGEGPLLTDEIKSLEEEVEKEHGQPPFDLLLGFALVVGCLLGVKAFPIEEKERLAVRLP